MRMGTNVNPQKIGDILRDFLEASGLSSKLKHLEVYSAWDEVAGPGLSPHTRVAGFTHHRLYIDVDSSAHMHELQTFYKQRLLDDLREKLPNILIQDLVFRPAPLSRS
jgi:predicted nucleic acid-binding Zn ribbon protein